VAGNTDIILEA